MEKIVNPKFSRDHLFRQISVFPLIHLKPAWLAKAVYTILNPRKVLQDRKRDRRMKENIANTIRESS